MNLTLRQLRAFLTVAELGSFTRAGERLHMAQPALSLLIRDLEAELCVKLFDRTTRRTELTQAGRELRPSIEKILGDLEHVVKSMNDLGHRRRGRIVVAAPPLLATTMLPNIISQFEEKYPGITVGIVDARTKTIVEKVRLGEVDCGIGTFSPQEDGIARTPLARDELMIFGHRSEKLLKPPTVRWSELGGRPLITLTRESGIRLLVEMGYESTGNAAQPKYEVMEITTALGLVEAGLGIAVLPTYALAFSGFKHVTARPLVDPVMVREISLIVAEGRTMSNALDAFARMLQTKAQQSVPTVTPRKTRRP